MIKKRIIPRHIAIVMDGNGRWAKEKGLPRTAGHNKGAKQVEVIMEAASDLGVSVLTLYAFSAENWSRPKHEIDILMRLLSNFLDNKVKQLNKNNIRFKVIGRQKPLPDYLIKKIADVEKRTAGNSGLLLVLALNYGSRQEIIDAVLRFLDLAVKGEVSAKDLNEETFSEYLYTAGMPDPDLFIRTSGEMRISNFLLWQLSYAELYFPAKYWPDFGKEDLEDAIDEYNKRERRFGGINAKRTVS
ncbi:isoprenyl transferase [bacterium]|nr:MAG: isoprenyl transferase [bacterium]